MLWLWLFYKLWVSIGFVDIGSFGIWVSLTRNLGSFLGEICGMYLKWMTLGWCVCESLLIFLLTLFWGFSSIWVIFSILDSDILENEQHYLEGEQCHFTCIFIRQITKYPMWFGDINILSTNFQLSNLMTS